MFARSSFCAVALSASLLSCAGSAASTAPAASEPAGGEPAGGEPADTSAPPAETASPPAGSSDAVSSDAVSSDAVSSDAVSSDAVSSDAVSSEAVSSEAVSAATSAAESWLKLVDDARYDASWTNAASLFRGAVTSDAWSKAVGGVRGPLGKLGSRRLASANYTTTAPGAPDGKYVIIQFDTSFEKKASAVETVTAMQDTDGVWRVAGYFIK